ncbi:MAG: recombinase family protein [Actinomyces sp. oral taxon 181]|nr:recombinase family protein [Actinomyces sp. oral taxon 181]
MTTIADLAEREINVQVIDPALDTSHPADKVVVNVMASMAEWERELLVERTREGVAHARAQGRVVGPKPKLSDEQARQARQLIASGESVASVAPIPLACPGRPCIGRWSAFLRPLSLSSHSRPHAAASPAQKGSARLQQHLPDL